ncbi:MAG: zinc-binding protein [Deltaproteobacteria bacterium]|nr:zinc-binding protein [Deltaproteobacteria bacterium]
MKRFFSMILPPLLAVFIMAAACEKIQDKPVEQQKKLKVVTTLFPLYDFAKNVGTKHADVSLLLPPGVEAHAYEPKPTDMTRIQNADIFIYTGKHMEPWVEDILKGIDTKKIAIVDASRGITLMTGTHEDKEGHFHKHESGAPDPHIWLDFSHAIKMVETISAGFITRDPQNRDVYLKNADEYRKRLEDLDRKYRNALSTCKKRIIIHAGHFAFGYLVKRYGLHYVSAYRGFTPDSEPTPKRLIELIDKLKKSGLDTIYHEELINPRVGEAISKETGARMLMLHGAHNITKDEMERRVEFIPVMEKNLENLKVGLQCQ